MIFIVLSVSWRSVFLACMAHLVLEALEVAESAEAVESSLLVSVAFAELVEFKQERGFVVVDSWSHFMILL